MRRIRQTTACEIVAPIRDTLSEIQKGREIIKKTILKNQETMKEYFDRHVVEGRLQPYDIVTRRCFVQEGEHRKMQPKFHGLYRIFEIKKNVAVIHPVGRCIDRRRRVPVDQLKKYVGDFLEPPNDVPPESRRYYNLPFEGQKKCPICMKEQPGLDMVLCEVCMKWHHMTCVNYGPRAKDDEDYICPKCTKYSWGGLPSSSDEESTRNRGSSRLTKKVISTQNTIPVDERLYQSGDDKSTTSDGHFKRVTSPPFHQICWKESGPESPQGPPASSWAGRVNGPGVEEAKCDGLSS